MLTTHAATGGDLQGLVLVVLFVAAVVVAFWRVVLWLVMVGLVAVLLLGMLTLAQAHEQATDGRSAPSGSRSWNGRRGPGEVVGVSRVRRRRGQPWLALRGRWGGAPGADGRTPLERV